MFSRFSLKFILSLKYKYLILSVMQPGYYQLQPKERKTTHNVSARKATWRYWKKIADHFVDRFGVGPKMTLIIDIH